MITITGPGKTPLILQNPVMIASGMMGFEPSTYRDLLKLEKLGAMVTAPFSWKPRGPAQGTRIVELPSGFLFHTGLPNPGLRKGIRYYQEGWKKSQIPIIVHLIDHRPADLHSCAQLLEGLENVVGIELGLREDVEPDQMSDLIRAIRDASQLPILVKLPLYNAPWLAQLAADSGADGVVVASPPRGTDRDPASGRLVGGRVYGHFLKPLVLRAVGQIAPHLPIPVVATGGIHHSDDARDFIDAGARAIQIDSLMWINPQQVEIIARNLGGLELTRAIGALEDEWEPGIGKTVMMKRQAEQIQARRVNPPPPPPEMPLDDEDGTSPAEPDDWDF